MKYYYKLHLPGGHSDLITEETAVFLGRSKNNPHHRNIESNDPNYQLKIAGKYPDEFMEARMRDVHRKALEYAYGNQSSLWIWFKNLVS